jgi:hypothetical protein
MEVRIGVVYSARELTIDTDESVEAVEQAVEAALGGEKLFWLTDTKGRRVGVPPDKIGYVEVAGGAGERQVGFGVR